MSEQKVQEVQEQLTQETPASNFTQILQLSELDDQKLVVELKRGQQRPTFELLEGKIKIRAAGVIFYKVVQNKQLQFLLRREFVLQENQKNKFADFGGKSDMIDENIQQNASREVKEESFSQLICEKNYVMNEKCIFNQMSRYLVFNSKLNDFNPELIGKQEEWEEDGQKKQRRHEAHWFSMEEVDQMVKDGFIHMRIASIWPQIKQLVREKEHL